MTRQTTTITEMKGYDTVRLPGHQTLQRHVRNLTFLIDENDDRNIMFPTLYCFEADRIRRRVVELNLD